MLIYCGLRLVMMIVKEMLVGVYVGLAVVGMRMDMDEIVILQEPCIGQYLIGLSATYYPFIPAEYMYNIGYLLDYMHIVRRRYYRLASRVVAIQEVDKGS